MNSIILKIILFNFLDVNSIVGEFTMSEVYQTDHGPVQGLILETVTNSMKFAAFKGIPYAEPPLGRQRFKPPVPKTPWNKTLITTNTSSSCPQWNLDDDVYNGDEDCLYLNVYTPKIRLNDTSLRPVMVWIYGGAFIEGYVNASKYGPDFILEENVILVAMSYRLGTLGFLSLDHPDATGNAGLKDQSLALKWVKKNIKNFGGDPNLITIFGQSAGSVAIQLHKLSPMSRGLFERSIAMSGSPLNFWGISILSQAVMRAKYLAYQLNITSANKTEILEEFYKVPAEAIIVATRNLEILDLPFKPTIENPDMTDEPFLSDCPISLYEAGNFSDEPHILGFVGSETISFGGSVASFMRSVHWVLDGFVNVTGIRTISEIINLENIVNSSVTSLTGLGYDVVYAVVNVTTDLAFVGAIDRTQQFLSSGKGPVYYYRNIYDYPQALHKVRGNQLNGTAHSDDIAHIFWVSDRNQTTDPNEGISLQRARMVKMWTNMAKYGNPTPNGDKDFLLHVKWPESGENGTCLEIDHKYRVIPRPIDTLLSIIRTLVAPLWLIFGGCPSTS